MRSVNVAELKNSLSRYLAYAKGGEEIVIKHRQLPIAKLVPLSASDVDEEDLALVAEGKMRLPKGKLDIKKFLSIPTGRVRGRRAIQAVIDDREEGL